MRVYYDNIIPKNMTFQAGTAIESNEIGKRLFSPYLSFKLHVVSDGTETVRTSWFTSGEPITSVLVAGENIQRFRIMGQSGEDYPFVETPDGTGAFFDAAGIAEPLICIEIIAGVAQQPVVLYSLYAGGHLDIPNMLAGPKTVFNLNTKMDRSFDGFATGYHKKSLKEISCGFVRVKDNIANNVLYYVDTMKNITPHWIDVWPEAHDHFPPFWGTLVPDSIAFQKRPENGFLWDFQLGWMEAK